MFNRTFSTPNDPYAGLTFNQRDSRIVEPSGAIAFEAKNITVPSLWNQVAIDVLAQKYFRKAGVPDKTVKIAEDGVPEWLQRSEPAPGATLESETDARQVFGRLAGCWTYWGWKCGYFVDENEARVYFDEMRSMLARQIAAPNSPQFFNTGLHWAYGIAGPAQGHYYVDPFTKELTRAQDAYSHPAISACYILGLEDELIGDGGIYDWITREARIFKFGAGSGVNVSKLRAKGEKLSGGGTSSGMMSWLRIADRSAGAIKSGGTTRRAAKMLVLDADHPDIEEYIDWKVKEEQKVAQLVTGSIVFEKYVNAILRAARNEAIPEDQRLSPKTNEILAAAMRAALAHGIPGASLQQALELAKQGIWEIDAEPLNVDWQGEAYNTVSGQNANNSVRIPNEFFAALDDLREWPLTRRTDGSVSKMIAPTDLWDSIALAAWKCADPGLHYSSTMNEWHTSPSHGPINATNPCSEFVYVDNSACNLASLRLTAFEDSEKRFDAERFAYAVHLWTMTLEISVSMGELPSPDVAQNTYELRPLGLGFADLGTLLMRMGLPYDSENGRNWAAAISALLSGQAYKTSAEIAKRIGPFPAYEKNADAMLRVIRNHRRAANDALAHEYEGLSVTPTTYPSIAPNAHVWDLAREAWAQAESLGTQHGFRNGQVTVIAPTGTIGLLMSCDTTGVEPDFALVKFKKLAGGGYFKIVNHSVGSALEHLGYEADEIKGIETYAVGTGELSDEDRALLTPAQADAINPMIPSSMSLEMAASMAGVELPKIDRSKLDEISQRVCGLMTLEGAPLLRDEDIAVFDCATPCGLTGTRFISPRAHVDMMAAVQPFVSGSISKTVNLPQSATIAEIQDLYRYGWKKMLKCIAIYRDGSKLSQPLSGSYALEPSEGLSSPLDVAQQIVYRYIAQKRKMPKRAGGYRQKFSIGGHHIYVHTGEYQDRTLGEIFISTSKEGAAFKALLNCFAIAISIGLQHGVPLEEFVEAYTFTKFEPNGPVVGHDRIKMCTSIVDALFRDLAITYLDRQDLAHVEADSGATTIALDGGNESGIQSLPAPEIITNASHFNGETMSKAKGYTGNACPECMQLTMVRSGACEKCDSCGATSGCS